MTNQDFSWTFESSRMVPQGGLLMSCDYQTIRRDNERRYGTDIGRIGPMLLADRYDDRTHFIFELLQNAEDPLARRHRSNLRARVSCAPSELYDGLDGSTSLGN